MRDEIDRLIGDALEAEERDLLARIGEEQPYFSQIGALFGGRTGWVSAMLLVVQTLLFIASVYAAWKFFDANDALNALHWGLPSAVLLLASLSMKLALWPVIHTNRLMREVKKLELQLALTRKSA